MGYCNKTKHMQQYITPQHMTTMAIPKGKKLRQEGIALAMRQDSRVKYLYETCK